MTTRATIAYGKETQSNRKRLKLPLFSTVDRHPPIPDAALCTQHPEYMKSLLQPLATVDPDPSRLDKSHEQDAFEYLRAENRVLREKLGKKHILFDDNRERPRGVH